MRYRNKKAFIILIILFISIGFAYLSTQLSIIGLASVQGNKWDIYFENVQVSSGSVTAEVPVIDTNKTRVDYSCSLKFPGDYFEFTVDVKNAGTIDAAIKLFNNTNLTSEQEKYLDYYIVYEDGSEIQVGDIVKANQKDTYKIHLEFKRDINNEHLPENNISNLNFSFSVEYVQDSLDSTFIDLVKNSARLDTNINFSSNSSASNGDGLNILSATASDKYPIYYYRGAVNNNNAKFGGFCWKIIRTTKRGGIKMIYNGLPDNDGFCTNTTGTSTQVKNVSAPFNSLAYGGYMYGKVYEVNNISVNSNYLFGSSFTYNNGVYTLQDVTTDKSLLSTHHYTCLNETNTCTEISFIVRELNDYYYYFNLQNGEGVEYAVDAMLTNSSNTVDNPIKVDNDTWYENNLLSYSKYLEDTEFCNDRGVQNLANFASNGPVGVENFLFNNFETPTDLSCNSKNDTFTVSNKIGNGALKYPVGLITRDEAVISGSGAKSSYLYTGQKWVTMTPAVFSYTSIKYFVFESYGGFGYESVDGYAPAGLRPVIALRRSVKVESGTNGTSNNPYTFILN